MSNLIIIVIVVIIVIFAVKGSMSHFKGEGGCCGKISKDILAFTGKLSLHRDCDRIKSFLRNYNIYSLELSNKPLTDVGSILPVIQEAE